MSVVASECVKACSSCLRCLRPSISPPDITTWQDQSGEAAAIAAGAITVVPCTPPERGPRIIVPGVSVQQSSDGQVVEVGGGVHIIQNADGQTITVGGMTIKQTAAGQFMSTDANQGNFLVKSNKKVLTRIIGR